jgi:uncharacterized membrane protein YkvA (DUF1232 family)
MRPALNVRGGIRKRAGTLVSRFRDEVLVYRIAIRDPRTCWFARLLLCAAAAYVLSPVDLIPDFIPVLGQIDDLIIVPLLVWAAIRLLPAKVIADSRDALQNASEVQAQGTTGRIGPDQAVPLSMGENN